MTPVRAPDLVRGTDLRELPRCMPVTDLRPATRFNGEPVTRRGVYVGNNTVKADEGLVVWTHYAHVRDEWPTYIGHLAIDWSDRAAIYLSLAWLADRGHACLWMLPTTHGGRAEAWAELTAWEVSAILVARSVLRVARGLGPVSDVLGSWRAMANSDPDTGATWIRSRIVNPKMRGGGLWVCERLQPWRAFGWECSLVADPERTWTWLRGPETGDAGKLAADRAALADGYVLQVPGGLILPDLGADHE